MGCSPAATKTITVAPYGAPKCTAMAVVYEPAGGTQPSWISVADFLAPCGITFSGFMHETNPPYNSYITATNPAQPQNGSYIIHGETLSNNMMYRDQAYLQLVLNDLTQAVNVPAYTAPLPSPVITLPSPGIQTGLTLIFSSQTAALLSWPSVSGATSYLVGINIQGGSNTQQTITGTSIAVTIPSNVDAYFYVTACNASGCQNEIGSLSYSPTGPVQQYPGVSIYPAFTSGCCSLSSTPGEEIFSLRIFPTAQMGCGISYQTKSYVPGSTNNQIYIGGVPYLLNDIPGTRVGPDSQGYPALFTTNPLGFAIWLGSLGGNICLI